MDCLFNECIPEGTEKKIILRPISKTFINGLASSYESNYHDKLIPFIENREFHRIIDKLNSSLYMMWPCCLCFTFGYICSLCTAGLSFCFPYICISEAKERFDSEITNINSYLNSKRLHISYKSKCSTSWKLEIDIMDSINEEKVILNPRLESNNNGIIRGQHDNIN